MESTVARRPMHTRRIELQAYARDDGLWDIEAQLRDEKPFSYFDPGRGQMNPGDAVHDIYLRLTLDDARVIRDVAVEMGSMPFGTCHEVRDTLRPLIGVTIGRGWRQALRQFARNATCTHVQELLVPMATVLFQAVPFGRDPEGKVPIAPDHTLAEKPFFVDDCYSWRADGPVVAHFYPKLAKVAKGKT